MQLPWFSNEDNDTITNRTYHQYCTLKTNYIGSQMRCFVCNCSFCFHIYFFRFTRFDVDLETSSRVFDKRSLHFIH